MSRHCFLFSKLWKDHQDNASARLKTSFGRTGKTNSGRRPGKEGSSYTVWLWGKGKVSWGQENPGPTSGGSEAECESRNLGCLGIQYSPRVWNNTCNRLWDIQLTCWMNEWSIHTSTLLYEKLLNNIPFTAGPRRLNGCHLGQHLLPLSAENSLSLSELVHIKQADVRG